MLHAEIPLVAVTFRLREVLEAAGVSQSEAARRSGVSFATINRMCTNATRQVSLDVIDALCQALGVEPGALLEREGKRKRGK
jgi:DNA-binding Xre family transcriptional regulator